MRKLLATMIGIICVGAAPVQAFAATYIVKQGDTLYQIARQYQTTPEALQLLNQLPSDRLAIGQALVVPDTDGRAQTVVFAAEPALAQKEPVPFQPNVSMEVAPAFGQMENPPSATLAMVQVPSLNVRQSPSLEAAILSKATYGTLLEVVEMGSEWTSVRVNGEIAFVATSYIRSYAPANSPSQTKGDSAFAEQLMEIVQPLLNTPYVLGGMTPDGFDCSGFTSYVYQQLGITLPRTSEEQYLYGLEVPAEEMQVGDLLFYDSLAKGKVSHVAIYIGNGLMVHANGTKVGFEEVEDMNKLYPFYGVKRYLAAK